MEGSWARIASCVRRSSGPGSSPSCSTCTRRADWYASERVGRAPAPVEREHQLPPESLPKRALRDRLLELGDDLAMLAELERRLEALLERIDAELLEPIRLGADRVRVSQTLQRRSAPRARAPGRDVGRRTRIAVAQRRARLDEQVLEDERVGARIREGIAVGRPDDGVLAERRTQARDVMLNSVSGRSGHVGAPQVVDESVDRDRAPASQCEQRKERVALRPTCSGPDVRRR
jgi:hypothetical protein